MRGIPQKGVQRQLSSSVWQTIADYTTPESPSSGAREKNLKKYRKYNPEDDKIQNITPTAPKTLPLNHKTQNFKKSISIKRISEVRTSVLTTISEKSFSVIEKIPSKSLRRSTFSKHLFGKIFFLFWCVFCFGLMVWCLKARFSDYMTAGTEVSHKILTKDSMDFPKVTICMSGSVDDADSASFELKYRALVIDKFESIKSETGFKILIMEFLWERLERYDSYLKDYLEYGRAYWMVESWFFTQEILKIDSVRENSFKNLWDRVESQDFEVNFYENCNASDADSMKKQVQLECGKTVDGTSDHEIRLKNEIYKVYCRSEEISDLCMLKFLGPLILNSKYADDLFNNVEQVVSELIVDLIYPRSPNISEMMSFYPKNVRSVLESIDLNQVFENNVVISEQPDIHIQVKQSPYHQATMDHYFGTNKNNNSKLTWDKI